jgi:hypothetical protein
MPFTFPAQIAIVPQVLLQDQLQAGNTFVQGTAQLSLFLGPAVLANRGLVEGAAAFGIIMSAFGGRSLLGIVLSGVLPAPKPEHFGTVVLLVVASLGIGVTLLPLFGATAVIAGICLVMGAVADYQRMLLFTWLQKRIPEELMGRVMSLLFFCAIGLAPVSNALAGALLDIDLNGLFIGSGVLMAAVTLLAILLPEIRQMGVETAGINRTKTA